MGGKQKIINENLDPSLPLDNVRWEKFCQNLMVGMGNDEAYQGAGYNAKSNGVASVNANKLLKMPKVANRIAHLKNKSAEAQIANITELLNSMTAILRLSPFEVEANLKKYGQYIQDVEWKTVQVRDEKGKVQTRRVIKKLKMVSKAAMYKLIGKYYKMFTDNIDLNAVVHNVTVSMDDFNAAIEKLKNEK